MSSPTGWDSVVGASVKYIHTLSTCEPEYHLPAYQNRDGHSHVAHQRKRFVFGQNSILDPRRFQVLLPSGTWRGALQARFCADLDFDYDTL